MAYRATNVDELLKLMKALQGERPQAEYARSIGVSPQYLNDVYNRRADPGKSILTSLGVVPEMVYHVPETVIRSAATMSQTGSTHAQGTEVPAPAAKEEGKKRQAGGKRQGRK